MTKYKNIRNLSKNQIYLIKRLKPIYIYNPLTRKDRPISYYSDNVKTLHITLNPLKHQKVDELKAAFNYAKNKYGSFMYGRHWTEHLKLNYDLAIEKQHGYWHIHLILRDMTLNQAALFYNYIVVILQEIYPKLSSYAKIQDKDIVLFTNTIGKNELNLIKYDSKNQDSKNQYIKNVDNETFFYSSKDFIK